MSDIAMSGPLGPLFTWFDTRLVPPLRAFGETSAMVAIRDALPISFGGLIAGIVIFFWFIHAPTIGQRIFPTVIAAFGVMSLVLVAILAYVFARKVGIAPLFASAVSLAVFTLALPQPYGRDMVALATRLGPSGLLLAIIIALGSVGVLAAAEKRLGRLGQLGAALALIACAYGLFAAHISLAEGVAAVMRPLGTLGDSFVAFIAIIAIETLLWAAGIHGPALLAGVVTPVYLALQFQNTAAYQAHAPLPHIVTTSLFLFAFPGGAGATLPLVFLLLRSSSARMRKVAYAALVPAMFNINEPLLLGLPMVMNPIMVVPLVIVPVVLAAIAYGAVAFELVGRPVLYVPSSVPSPIAVFVATGDWRSVVLLAVNVVVAGAIYLPFVRAYERSADERGASTGSA